MQIADLQAEAEEYPEGREFALRFGRRTILAVPLIRAATAIGVINVRRTEVRPFTDKQIALLKTFADQAVIAIETTRLFEAAQAGKRELQEALKQQVGAAASGDTPFTSLPLPQTRAGLLFRCSSWFPR
jgi:GAF domain-containing protein